MEMMLKKRITRHTQEQRTEKAEGNNGNETGVTSKNNSGKET